MLIYSLREALLEINVPYHHNRLIRKKTRLCWSMNLGLSRLFTLIMELIYALLQKSILISIVLSLILVRSPSVLVQLLGRTFLSSAVPTHWIQSFEMVLLVPNLEAIFISKKMYGLAEMLSFFLGLG